MSIDHHQIAALLELVRTVARAEIMLLFRNLPIGGIRAKTAPDDLVTQADVAAELALTRGIKAILPGAVVIGEEAVSADPGVLERLEGADLAVIVDPIDGTWNYANGLTMFGVILAVVAQGQTVWGLLYDPVMDDWVTASPGNGAWYNRPGTAPLRQTVSAQADLPDLAGYLPIFQFPKAAQPGLAALAQKMARTTTLRCSCHEYRQLAQGSADFCINTHSAVWDHAAGALILTEAGGAVGFLDGTPYAAKASPQPLIAAQSHLTLDRLRDHLHGVPGLL